MVFATLNGSPIRGKTGSHGGGKTRQRSQRLSRGNHAPWIAVSLILSILIPSQPAWASPCPNEFQIFVRVKDVAKKNINGTWSKIQWRDRFLDQDCEATAASTAFISKGNAGTQNFGTWIEMGWRHDTGRNFARFTEKGFNFTRTQHSEVYFANDPPFGAYAEYRVANCPKNPNGTTDWHLQYRCRNCSNFTTQAVYNTLWHKGVAHGETVARGNDTGMHDQQRALKYKKNNLNFVAWPGVDCRLDTSPANGWHRVSDQAYDVVDCV